MEKSKIYVAVHLVGSAILANLISKGYNNIVTCSQRIGLNINVK